MIYFVLDKSYIVHDYHEFVQLMSDLRPYLHRGIALSFREIINL